MGIKNFQKFNITCDYRNQISLISAFELCRTKTAKGCKNFMADNCKQLEGNKIEKFEEKTQGDGGWINGGFFVLEPDVFELIEGDATVWEREPLEALAKNGELSAWFHRGFWRPMDTMRDKMALEKMWQAGSAPWKACKTPWTAPPNRRWESA